MKVFHASEQPCYSARLLAPFIALLREDARIPKNTIKWLESIDPDERVHVSAMHTMLEGALGMTGDHLLGVKASRSTSMGDVGVFDFVMSSAETLRAGLESAGRFMRLLNDTLDFTLEVEGEGDGERAVVRLENRVIVPPLAEDFQTCGLISNQAPGWPEGLVDDLDVWFRHPAPPELNEYHNVLGTSARLHFQAPLSGFGFAGHFLDAPLRRHDPKLHDVVRRYAELTLASLPRPESVTEKVRRLIIEQLPSGDFSLEDTARKLRMSSRTLGRRLAEEGTSFKSLVDDTRRRIALRYVAGHDFGLSEVALLAGFTETPSFYRAFRRWTGMTPSKYRWTHRGDLRGLR